MHVIVLGAGVIGVTTAYYLAKAGCQVTVIDRQQDVGLETSFANAGLVTSGHPQSWASPHSPFLLLRSQLLYDSSLRLSLSKDPKLWRWAFGFSRNCLPWRYRRNSLRILSLALYSQQLLRQMRNEHVLRYDQRQNGVLYLYRSKASFERGLREAELFMTHGLEQKILSPVDCIKLEPALKAVENRLAGAIYAPQDESGDCLLFTHAVTQLCLNLGVTFHMGTRIRSLEIEGDKLTAVVTDRGNLMADSYVLALGSFSSMIAKLAKTYLPIIPVKGYSITVPAFEEGAPVIGGVDDENFLAFSRLGDRLRITAGIEFAGHNTQFTVANFSPMLKIARELFPKGGDYSKPKLWSCLRPVTPSGLPILGRGRQTNLFINTGHGHLGWTMACGSSKITADLLLGQSADHDTSGLLYNPKSRNQK